MPIKVKRITYDIPEHNVNEPRQRQDTKKKNSIKIIELKEKIKCKKENTQDYNDYIVTHDKDIKYKIE
jgi:hypothetical protein